MKRLHASFLTAAVTLTVMFGSTTAHAQPGRGFDPRFAKARLHEILPGEFMEKISGFDAKNSCFAFADSRQVFLYLKTRCKQGEGGKVFGPEEDLKDVARILPFVARRVSQDGAVSPEFLNPEFRASQIPQSIAPDLKSKDSYGTLGVLLRDEFASSRRGGGKTTVVDVATFARHPKEPGKWIFTSVCQLAARREDARFQQNCRVILTPEGNVQIALVDQVHDSKASELSRSRAR